MIVYCLEFYLEFLNESDYENIKDLSLHEFFGKTHVLQSSSFVYELSLIYFTCFKISRLTYFYVSTDVEFVNGTVILGILSLFVISVFFYDFNLGLKNSLLNLIFENKDGLHEKNLDPILGCVIRNFLLSFTRNAQQIFLFVFILCPTTSHLITSFKFTERI